MFSKNTVLIIEDDPMVRRVYDNCLGHLGYDVLQAGNGLEAINLVNNYKDPINVCILDLRMPVMDGFRTFWELRKLRPEMKIILCTGYENDEKIGELLNAGAFCLLIKPFNIRLLAEQIELAAR